MIDAFDPDSETAAIARTLGSGRVAHIRGFFDVSRCDAILRDLQRLFVEGYQAEGAADPHAFFAQLFATEKFRAMAMTYGRDLPSFQRLLTDERLHRLAADCLASECLIFPADWVLFRIDGRQTEQSRFDWHQDYLYNMLSRDALTFWIPLSDIDPGVGGLAFAPNPNRDIFPVRVNAEPSAHNPNRLPLQDLERHSQRWEREACVLNHAQAGDLILFDATVLHRSQAAVDDRFRFVANGRIGNALDPELLARDLYIARTKYPYLCKTVHPDDVLDPSEAPT